MFIHAVVLQSMLYRLKIDFCDCEARCYHLVTCGLSANGCWAYGHFTSCSKKHQTGSTLQQIL